MSQPVTHPAPYLAPEPRRRSNAGRIIGIVVTAVVIVLGGIAGALFLFGKPVLDEGKVQAEIVRITRDAAGGLEPTGVTCPKDVPLHAGDVSTCTAQLDGQAITYTVRQNDDQGNVRIESGLFTVVDKVEKNVVARFAQQDTSVTADCGGGKKVVVGGKGTKIECQVTNTADASDTTTVTATITDDQGNVDFS